MDLSDKAAPEKNPTMDKEENGSVQSSGVVLSTIDNDESDAKIKVVLETKNTSIITSQNVDKMNKDSIAIEIPSTKTTQMSAEQIAEQIDATSIEIDEKFEKSEKESEKQSEPSIKYEAQTETAGTNETNETSESLKFAKFKKPEIPPTIRSVQKDFGDYAEYVTFAEDGTAVYTDPKTEDQYKWSEKVNNWLPSTDIEADGEVNPNPFENEHYKWCSETQSWKLKITQVTETEHYKWDVEKNEWIPKQSGNGPSDNITYDVDEDGQRIYTDKDGAVYFWDETKSAWFPKIDDDFMARYQMNYGFIDNVSAGEEEKRKRDADEAKRKAEELQQMADEARKAMDATSSSGGAATGLKRKATQEPPKWFEIDAEHNTKVYVSSLPLDITLDEFAELMGKCGMIMRDPKTQKFKLKLYTEADGQIKGDGLCDYIKVESVNLALNILDEYVYRGHKIRVQPAKFEMRGEYNPALKPKKKKKDKEKLQKMKERLFDWRPEKMRGERTKNEKVVIIKNLFTPDIFEKEVQLILDYQNDLREECSKCGTVRKIVIYDCHSEGVAQVNMSSAEEADLVIQMMQGRYFGKRQLSAEHWDGKTKYKVAESEKEAQERLTNWDQFLEADAEKVHEK